MKLKKYPLVLRPVARQTKSAAQDFAFGRGELESAIRFLRDQPICTDLERALAALPQPTCLHLGCHRCNGDVPLDQPDLVEDRLCRPCADEYDQAILARKEAMRRARTDERLAA